MWGVVAKQALRWIGPSVLLWFAGDAAEKAADAVGTNLVTPTTQVLGVNTDGSDDWRVNMVSLGLVAMALAYAYGKIFGSDV